MPIHSFAANTFNPTTFVPIFGAGANLFPSMSAINRPASVNVSYPRWLEYRQLRGELRSLGFSDPDVSTTTTGKGTYKQVFSSAYWKVPDADSASDTAYRAKLQSLTNIIGTDYYAWLETRYSLVFQNVVAWEPTGFDDCVVWEVGAQDESSDGQGWVCHTRVESLPENIGVSHQLSQFPDLFTIGHSQIGILKETLGVIPSGGSVVSPSGKMTVWISKHTRNDSAEVKEYANYQKMLSDGTGKAISGGSTFLEITVNDFAQSAVQFLNQRGRAEWCEEAGKWIFVPLDCVHFRNDSTYEIPAGGIMAVTGYDVTNRAWIVGRPDSTFYRKYLVNGPIPIAYTSSPKTFGWGSWLEKAGRIKLSTGSGSIHDEWGPKTGFFEAYPYRPGFHLVSTPESEGGVYYANAIQREVTELIGKLYSGSISKGSSGSIKVWVGAAGSEAESEYAITCQSPFGAIANSKWCAMAWRNGVWYASQIEC